MTGVDGDGAARPLGGEPTRGRALRAPGRRAVRALLDAGNEVFAEMGFGVARVVDVTTRAGMSHASFYLYFENKGDLLRRLAIDCADAMDAVCRRAGTGTDPATELRAWLRDFVDTYRRHAGVIRVWNEEQVHDRAREAEGAQVRNDIVAAIGRILASATEPTQAELLVLGAFVEQFPPLFLGNARFAPDDVLETVAQLLQQGFTPR